MTYRNTAIADQCFVDDLGRIRSAVDADKARALPCSRCGYDRLHVAEMVRIHYTSDGGRQLVTWIHVTCPSMRARAATRLAQFARRWPYTIGAAAGSLIAAIAVARSR